MKKIFYVITKSNFGGAQKYVYELMTHLDRSLYSPTLVTGNEGDLTHRITESGFPVFILPSMRRDVSLKGDWGTLLSLIQLFRKEKPDIVHLNSSKAGFIGALAARIARVPRIIFTAHGWSSNEDRSFVSRYFFLTLHWLTVLLSHKTIAVSKKTARDIEPLPFTARRLTVIYNGIDDVLYLDKNTARDTLIKDRPARVVIGTISELHMNKGIDFALDALAKLHDTYNDFLFVVIGEGEKKADLEKRIKERGLSNNVVLVGRVNNAREYLKAFDIFTLTSRTEALPFALLEAGHAALPVVASNIGGVSEIISHKKEGLLVPAGDVKSIATALQTLIEDFTARASYGENLKQKIQNEFSMERMIRDTEALYTKN